MAIRMLILIALKVVLMLRYKQSLIFVTLRSLSLIHIYFGFTNDPTALFCGLVDLQAREIYVFDELYQKGLTNRQIADRIISMGYSKSCLLYTSRCV